MVAQKEVKVKVATDVELSKVKSLEENIRQLNQQRIQLKIDADAARLDEVNRKIEGIDKVINTTVDLNEEELTQLKTELAQLESEKLDLEISIEQGKLGAVKSDIDALDDEPIVPQVDNISALNAVDQIGQGFDRLKQGAREIGQQMGTILEAAGKQETNKTFLEMAVGADAAGSKMEEINKIVQDLPGDDTVLQGLLSSAVAKDASLTSEALTDMGSSAADYFAAMSYYGKSASEAQQDMTNYLLAGNTAELERSPILQGHIDKLKEATTVQERAKVLQQALNEEHWGGMSTQDTYNNKLETFNGMLERGRYNLGGMFKDGAMAGMDFIMKLDESTNGIIGMGIAAAGFASPLTDALMGLGQMATGIKAIKDLGFIKYLKDLELMTKLSAAADWLLSGAQAVLNAIMSMNPIVIVVLALIALAAALIWAYYNVDWFRQMVDNAWASIVQFATFLYESVIGALTGLGEGFSNVSQIIWDSFINAINWVMTALQNLWNYIVTLGGLLPANVQITGNSIVDTILRVMAFILTLPLQIAMVFANIIAKTLGFGDNFVQGLISSATSAVSGFASYIASLPGIVMDEFNRVLGLVNDFINSLPDRVWDMGQAIIDALKKSLGIGSPGHMYYMFEGELERLDKLPEDMKGSITRNVRSLGTGIVDSFNPELGGTANARIGSGQVNNFYFSDVVVDNDDRMQRIVDYVARSINWNNTTAGRSEDL